MTLSYRQVLGVAAASTKLGHIFLIDGVPYDWGASKESSGSPQQAFEYTRKKIAYYRPDLLVTELVTDESKKGQYSRSLINMIAKAAQEANIKWCLVARNQAYANKYQEAQALAKRFPELKATLPGRRYWWQTEDPRMIIFEALALSLSIIDGTNETDNSA